MNRALAFKTVVLLMALFGVVYVIKSLNSKPKLESNEAFQLLLGGDSRPLNWCPAQTALVEVYTSEGVLAQKLDKAPEISMVCELMINGFSSEGIDPKSYRKKMVATGANAAHRSLEEIPGRDVYRVDGMPFSSPMLQKALERQGLNH